MLRYITFLAFMFWGLAALAEPQVRDVRLGLQEGGGTRFVLELDRSADYHLFLLANPFRAVIDLPALSWGADLQPASRGLIKGWRHGEFGNGTRVVLDLSAPARVVSSQIIPAQDGQGRRLVVDLAAATSQELDSLIGQSWGERNAHSGVRPTALAGIFLPPPLPERRRQQDPRPLVVIDAGHGGVDPGALSVTGRREKDITLAIALRLAEELKGGGHYRIKLTRSRDIFIPLRERVRIAREVGADLFVSLHADSIRGRNVRGATVYTLSEKASDDEAQALADSENRADQLAGLEQAGDNDTLANILIDMSHRATLNHGRDLSAALASSMRRNGIRMSSVGQRSAGFAVLKAPDVPSVLIEMGYLSSPEESRQLTQIEHQRKLAQAMATGIDSFFRNHRPNAETLAVLR